jgi:hypothetical protein
VTEERGVSEYQALRRLSQQPQLLRQFASSDTSKEAERTLALTSDVARRVKEILAGVQLQELHRDMNFPAKSHADGSSEGEGDFAVKKETDSAKKFLDSSFGQLRHAYLTLLVMSIVTFSIGVGFLILAAVQSVNSSRDPAQVAIIGGIGIIQLVAIFLRNPLRDIERAAAKAQQSRIAIMGYMLAVGLIGESVYNGATVAPDLDRLDHWTDSAIARLKASDADREAQNGSDVANGDLEGTGSPSR